MIRLTDSSYDAVHFDGTIRVDAGRHSAQSQRSDAPVCAA
jgi:hypothetical protein